MVTMQLQPENFARQPTVTVAAFFNLPHVIHIIFGTYQSAQMLNEAQRLQVQSGRRCQCFHWAFFDEAHRTAGRGEMYRFALDNRNVDINQRIFATASQKNIPSVGALDMSNERMYGNV